MDMNSQGEENLRNEQVKFYINEYSKERRGSFNMTKMIFISHGPFVCFLTLLMQVYQSTNCAIPKH